jgi:hypothetical protein
VGGTRFPTFAKSASAGEGRHDKEQALSLRVRRDKFIVELRYIHLSAYGTENCRYVMVGRLKGCFLNIRSVKMPRDPKARSWRLY